MTDSPIPVQFISADAVPIGVLGNVIRGPAGANFQPSATGLFSLRSTYNSQPPGFAFLATDTGMLYFREGLAPGGWSTAIPFAASAAYVLEGDARLSDARTPTTHTQAFSTITATPTTLLGYGITDAVGTSDIRLSDPRTPTAHNQAWSTITGTPTTLSGYGITNGFTEANVRATPLTGFVSGAGTVAAADSVLSAIQKLNGNVAAAVAGSVTAVTGTAPIVSSGGATPALSISPATTSAAGSLSSADKTKIDSITVNSATVVRKLVRNNSGVTIAKGQAVYQTGSSGVTITVALADASAEATASQTLGLAQDAIADNATGYVIAVGELTGVNSAALTEGQILWLSETTGGLTTTRPTQPAHGVVLGYCVKQGAGTSGILYVKVDNGLELDELHDVLISSPSTGQVLRRASDGLWKNATLAAADMSGLATVATTGAYTDLTGKPTLGTAALANTEDFATAAQGIDSREWSAPTITVAEYEAGTSTDRVAVTPALLADHFDFNFQSYITSDFSAKFTDVVTGGSGYVGLYSLVTGGILEREEVRATASYSGLDLAYYQHFRWTTAISANASFTADSTNLADLLASSEDYSWLGTLTFTYTSGALTFFSGSTGYTVSWENGVTPDFISGQTYVIGVTISGGTGQIRLQHLNAPDLLHLVFAMSDTTTALTAGNGKEQFVVEKAFVLNQLPAFNAITAPDGAALIVDINKNGTSIFSTLPRIDAAGTRSLASATQGVMTSSTISFAVGDVLRADITQIGATVAGAGLRCALRGYWS